MSRILPCLAFFLVSPGLLAAPNPLVGTTFCNPVNLDYHFQNKKPNWRQAADPQVFVFKGDFYLFASKSDGYWWSPDLATWNFVKPTGINIDKFAPSVFNIGEVVYYTSSEGGNIYRTDDLKAGHWTDLGNVLKWADPAVLVDDDGKVYAYTGSGKWGSIEVVHLDPARQFAVMGPPTVCITVDAKNHGFVNRGDNNEKLDDASRKFPPWIEGAWITRHEGKYYLQYAVPATEERSYADGCYVADSPTGPFVFCPQSPVSFKPLGFMTGLGHGSTFEDLQGKYWHITCAVISNFHMFERRLAIFPATFDTDGMFHCKTIFADYPQYLPGKAPAGAKDNLVPDCMLLSYGKTASASSSLGGHPISAAFDEDIKTWWSAETANPDESLTVDLGRTCEVAAIQTNFAEQDALPSGEDRVEAFAIRYKIEGAEMAEGPFKMLIDKSRNDQDTPHDYVPLAATAQVRFLRISNAGPMPGGGKFAIRDFRIFGNAHAERPAPVTDFSVSRSREDPRSATISWKPVANADGYILRFGISPDELYNHYQIWGGSASSKDLHSLNIGVPAYFTIDAYNASGLTRGTISKE